MKKYIYLNVIKAENVICVWREDGINADCDCGIALDDAERHFMVPRYIAVATFADGTAHAAGLFDLNVINEAGGNVFLYDEFCHAVGLNLARAFVRGAIKNGEYSKETDAKAGIYDELSSAGVYITPKAEAYLKNKEQS